MGLGAQPPDVAAEPFGRRAAAAGRFAPMMRRMRWAEMDEPARAALCNRGLEAIFDADLKRAIGAIIDDVREHGDEAVCRALHDFDHVDLAPDQLRATDDELDSACVDDDVDAAIDDAIAHLRAFNEQLMARAADWSFESEPGLQVGEKVTPISSAGLFVPSGKASYPSVAYQLGVPAMVAGVPEVALVVPPLPDGSGRIDPAVLVVCRKLGLRDVFRVNGPAGVAALGFGTASIPQVRKIVGPGSPPVACAQVEMQRYGVATMMILGPTESVVIADDSADPAPRRRRPAQRGRARHRLRRAADHPVAVAGRRSGRCAARPDRGPAGGPGRGGHRLARHQRRLRAGRLARDRPPTWPTAGRPSTCRWRCHRLRRTSCSTAW